MNNDNHEITQISENVTILSVHVRALDVIGRHWSCPGLEILLGNLEFSPLMRTRPISMKQKSGETYVHVVAQRLQFVFLGPQSAANHVWQDKDEEESDVTSAHVTEDREEGQ